MKIVGLYKFSEKKYDVSLYEGEKEELAEGQGEVEETLKPFDNYAGAKEYAEELAFKHGADIVEN